jgi:hypothetical protein
MDTKIGTTIIGEPISYVDFIKNIKRLDCISALMLLQMFSALLKNQSGLNIKIEFKFHVSSKINHNILLSRHCISFLSKEIILNCKNSNIRIEDIDLIKLTHQYEIMKTDLNETNPESSEAWLWVLRATNLQHFYLRVPVTVIARYYFIFISLTEKDAALTKSINNTLQLDILSLIKIGYCISALLMMNKSFTKERLINTNIPYLKTLLNSTNVEKFIDLFSANQTDFKEELKKFKIRNKLLKKYEFNPLKRFPIIKTDSSIENEKYIIPSHGDFIYAFSEGLYYVLLDKLSENDKQIFLKRIGNIFEEYIGSLIQSYNVDLLSRSKLYGEIEYKVGKSSWKSADWLLVSEKYIFQIECKKRKPNQHVKAGITSVDQGVNNLISSIAIELNKMIEKERHIQNGLLKSVQYNNQKIINVIVYLDEMFAINKYGRREVIAKLKKPQTNFNIFGCHEFEIICQLCRNKNIGLLQGISRLDSGEVYDIDFLNDIFSEFISSLKSP